MTESTETSTVAVNVALQPLDHSDQPVSANYSSVGVAQGIAYLDFGFLEPAQLAGVARKAKEGNGVSPHVNGTLVVRVAMGLDVVQRLHQQLQQVLVGMRPKPSVKS
jgi:hypothetical protein